jgi:hypothetical protein
MGRRFDGSDCITEDGAGDRFAPDIRKAVLKCQFLVKRTNDGTPVQSARQMRGEMRVCIRHRFDIFGIMSVQYSFGTPHWPFDGKTGRHKFHNTADFIFHFLLCLRDPPADFLIFHIAPF